MKRFTDALDALGIFGLAMLALLALFVGFTCTGCSGLTPAIGYGQVLAEHTATITNNASAADEVAALQANSAIFAADYATCTDPHNALAIVDFLDGKDKLLVGPTWPYSGQIARRAARFAALTTTATNNTLALQLEAQWQENTYAESQSQPPAVYAQPAMIKMARAMKAAKLQAVAVPPWMQKIIDATPPAIQQQIAADLPTVVTMTVDEIQALIAFWKAGNTDAADAVLVSKMSFDDVLTDGYARLPLQKSEVTTNNAKHNELVTMLNGLILGLFTALSGIGI
jgi:hypothetical protein